MTHYKLGEKYKQMQYTWNVENVPRYLRHPIQRINRKWIEETMKLTEEEKIMEQMYPKACRHFGEAANPSTNIGVNLNVAESPYCVIDFDINKSLPIEEIDRIAQQLIDTFEFKNGIVRTANGGLKQLVSMVSAWIPIPMPMLGLWLPGWLN